MSCERSENVRMMLNAFQKPTLSDRRLSPDMQTEDCRRGSDRVRGRGAWGTDEGDRYSGQGVWTVCLTLNQTGLGLLPVTHSPTLPTIVTTVYSKEVGER